jgi:P-type Cu+ transporter
VKRLDDRGTGEYVPVSQLKPGDRIRIHSQEVVPADSELISELARIDYSFVTGESTPIRKSRGELIYAGGRQTGAAVELEVRKAVDQSYLTQLWNQSEHDKNNSKITPIIDRVSRTFTAAVIVVSVATGLIWYMIDPSRVFIIVTAVLIVACPCALALAVPFTLGNTMRLFGRRGFYLKNTTAAEQLASTDTIVFDKTGTLTQARDARANYEGRPLSPEEKIAVKSACANSIHPLSRAIAQLISGQTETPDSFSEQTGKGIRANVNGVDIRLGSREWIEGKREENPDGQTRSLVEINGEVRGSFTISKSYREGLADLIGKLKDTHQLYLLSGDNDSARTELTGMFDTERMHFRQSPEDKLRFVKSLRLKGQKVLMVGDGLNDAGALRESDAGIAVADDMYGFSPACDAIMDARKFSLLSDFLAFSRTSLRVVRGSFVISLVYNLTGLAFAVTGHLSPLVAAILMPLSSVTVIGYSTLVVNLLGRKLK